MKFKYRLLLVPVAFGILSAVSGCKKSPYVTQGDIEDLTGKTVDEVFEVRSYDVDASEGLEQAAVYRSGDTVQVGIFTKGDSYSLVRNVPLDKGWSFVKMIFINPGLGYSHIILLTKSESSPKPYCLWIVDSKRLVQKMELEKDNIEQIFIDKEKDRAEEILKIGEMNYRFDSFAYIPLNETRPLFFIERIEVKGKDSWIVIKNKGKFTASAMITIGFPDIKPDEAASKVGLVADIPTVHYYAPGAEVFKRGGGKTMTTYPMIEIEKIPFGSHFTMKLPLFLGDNFGRMYFRIVYKYRGSTHYWPESDEYYKNITPVENGSQTITISKTQQGYWAYEYNH